MYQYYENKDTNQSVYLCMDEIEAFRRDVEALGLETSMGERDGRVCCVAADKLEGGKHRTQMELVKAACLTQPGFDPGERKDGPFPQERTFRICTVWEMWGASRVTATNLQAAIDQVLYHDGLPEGYYVDESQKLDEEADFTDCGDELKSGDAE